MSASALSRTLDCRVETLARRLSTAHPDYWQECIAEVLYAAVDDALEAAPFNVKEFRADVAREAVFAKNMARAKRKSS